MGLLFEATDMSEMSYSEKKFQMAMFQHFTKPLHKDAGKKIIDLLVLNGANVNQKAKYQKTPYGLAVELGNFYICSFIRTETLTC